MSVVVFGMEMPEDCDGCFVPAWHCNLWLGVDVGSRHEDCPLRSLPEKHGRLIEAERLRAEFPYPSEGMGGWRNPDEALVHKTGVWAAIDCAETIVEAEGENDA